MEQQTTTIQIQSRAQAGANSDQMQMLMMQQRTTNDKSREFLFATHSMETKGNTSRSSLSSTNARTSTERFPVLW